MVCPLCIDDAEWVEIASSPLTGFLTCRIGHRFTITLHESSMGFVTVTEPAPT